MEAELRSWSRIERRLHKRQPDFTGLAVDEQGVSLGSDFPLVRKVGLKYQLVSRDEIQSLLEIAFEGRGNAGAITSYLNRIAKALNSGEVARAQILGLHFPINFLSERQTRLLKRAAVTEKGGFNQDEPRTTLAAGPTLVPCARSDSQACVPGPASS